MTKSENVSEPEGSAKTPALAEPKSQPDSKSQPEPKTQPENAKGKGKAETVVETKSVNGQQSVSAKEDEAAKKAASGKKRWFGGEKKIDGEGERVLRRKEARALATKSMNDAKDTIRPKTAYDFACHYAGLTEYAKASDYLRIAVRNPLLTEAALIDPEFIAWRNDDKEKKSFFSIVVPKAPTDFWELEMFKPLKDKLIEAGVKSPAKLAEYTEPDDLRRFLGLARPPFKRLTNLSLLIAAAQKAPLPEEGEDLCLELVRALISSDIETRTDIPKEWTVQVPQGNGGMQASPELTGSDFYKLVIELKKKYISNLKDEELVGWIAKVGLWPDEAAPE